MKKIKLLFAVILITTQSFYGQVRPKDVKIVKGETSKSKSFVSEIIGSEKNGSTYYIKKKKGSLFSGLKTKIILEKLNSDMTLTNSNELQFKTEGKNLHFQFSTYLKGKIYVFSSFLNKKDRKQYLFVQSVNKSSLTLNNDRKKIAEVPYKKKWTFGSDGYFIDGKSKDKSKFAIYYKLPYSKKENEKFGFHVFNDDMELIWENKVTLPYSDKLFEPVDYVIDNLGNTYLLGKIFKDRKEKSEKNKPRYRYHILRYSNMGKKLDEYPISINEKFLNTLKLVVSDNQDLICGGFYSLIESKFLSYNEYVMGSFFLKIDGDSKKIVTKNFKEFDKELITQHLRKRQKRRAKKKIQKGKLLGLSDILIKDIIIKKDGGAYLVGEKEYSVTSTTTTTDANGHTSTRTTTTYYANEILVISVTPAGTIEWEEQIKKQQASGSYTYLSYAVANINDELFFVYNDNPKNLDYKEGDKFRYFSPGRKAVTFLLKINKDGYQKRRILFSKKEIGVYADPTIHIQPEGTKDLIFHCNRGKKIRFIKLQF